MAWISMSERDLRRIEVLSDVRVGRRTVAAAAAVLAVSERQAYRLPDTSLSSLILRLEIKRLELQRSAVLSHCPFESSIEPFRGLGVKLH